MSTKIDQPPIDDGEVIQPVTFAPAPDEAPKQCWRPGPVTSATIALLVIGAAVLWFLLSARSVAIRIDPETATLRIEGGFSLVVAGRQLLRPGDYRLSSEAPGHYPLEQTFTVTDEMDQSIELTLQRLPGLLELDTVPTGAAVHNADILIGVGGNEPIELAAERMS